MTIAEKIQSLDWLRKNVLGRNKLYDTPFGERPLVYLDYTASGRCVHYIEDHLNCIRQYYANSHTEDDFTGKTMTTLLHDAEKRIKTCVNAGPQGKIIFADSGTTGGIVRLQQILGVYLSPATKERYDYFLESCLFRKGVKKSDCYEALLDYIRNHKPIVFVSPYEHHSNEIMWRCTLCDVVEIPLNSDWQLDLEALEKIVSDPQYALRPKIGSFSAGSNVTGQLTDTYAVARILHRHNCLACFDFAACAPYIDIDMNKDEESFYDAIFFSPHKFLGGPGSSGVLIFNQRIYRSDLPPSIAAGGTVDYVSLEKEEYISDIETREKPGTPGIMQAIRTALVFELKKKVGTNLIAEIEDHFMKRFYDHFLPNKQVIFYGEREVGKKVSIIPFNIKYGDNSKILHPKLVTKLLSDLFGIQTRAGCSCAGPYGHRIMNINLEVSEKYRKVVAEDKFSGIKPGWIRLNLHYITSEEEFQYTVAAIDFVCKNGYKFLSQYEFNLYTGEWTHTRKGDFEVPVTLDIDELLASRPIPRDLPGIAEIDYADYLKQAEDIAEELKLLPEVLLPEHVRELVFFPVCLIKKCEDSIPKGSFCE
ncbi:MAG: aminotransferase class V-fold PLP-dependent enzyme [Candidatus Cloacimonetes bacterium]|nr:aminotransferase class V-fold PLP-dependent enzyme [Candidatus Cloacimonadota bacterium]